MFQQGAVFMNEEDDFDFKRMLEQISDPAYAAAAAQAAAAAAQQNSGGLLLHTNSFSMGLPGMSQGSSSRMGLSDQAHGGSSILHPNVEQIKREYSNSLSGSSIITGSSGSGNVISTRLRAASDMHQHGVISNEQKAVMKSLILSRDPQFREEYEKAERTQDWSSFKSFLASKQQGELSIGSASDAMSMAEFGIGKDRSGSASSIGALFDLGISRKRNASTSTPVIRSHKFPAGPTNEMASQSQQQHQEFKHGPAPAFGQSGRNLSPLSASALNAQKPAPKPFEPISQIDDGDEADEDKAAKFKKNERERRRRATLSNGFDALAQILKIPPDAKLEKAAILQHAVVRIAQLQNQVERLEAEKKYAQFERQAEKQQ